MGPGRALLVTLLNVSLGIGDVNVRIPVRQCSHHRVELGSQECRRRGQDVGEALGRSSCGRGGGRWWPGLVVRLGHCCGWSGRRRHELVIIIKEICVRHDVWARGDVAVTKCSSGCVEAHTKLAVGVKAGQHR